MQARTLALQSIANLSLSNVGLLTLSASIVSTRMPRLILSFEHRGDLTIQFSVFTNQWHQSFVRHHEGRAQGHRSMARTSHHPAINSTQLADPTGKFLRVSDRCGKQ